MDKIMKFSLSITVLVLNKSQKVISQFTERKSFLEIF